eukprot:1992083-Rhodomonas_salina.3
MESRGRHITEVIEASTGKAVSNQKRGNMQANQREEGQLQIQTYTDLCTLLKGYAICPRPYRPYRPNRPCRTYTPHTPHTPGRLQTPMRTALELSTLQPLQTLRPSSALRLLTPASCGQVRSAAAQRQARVPAALRAVRQGEHRSTQSPRVARRLVSALSETLFVSTF